MITQGNLRIMMRGPSEDVRAFREELNRLSGGTLFENRSDARRFVDQADASYFDVVDHFEMFALREVGHGVAECSAYVDRCERVWLMRLKESFPEVRICGILRNETNYAELYAKSGSDAIVMTDKRVAYRKNISFPIYSWWDKDEPFAFGANPDGTLCILKYFRWDRVLEVPSEYVAAEGCEVPAVDTAAEGCEASAEDAPDTSPGERLDGRHSAFTGKKIYKITSIAEDAFSDNDQTVQICLPPTITAVSPHAFRNCPNLVVCVDDPAIIAELLQAGVTAIDSGADPEQAQIEMHFTYEIQDGEARILSYVGEADRVVIPVRIEGCPVTAIGPEAFCQKEAHKKALRLEQVMIPDTVREIGRKAFYDTGLKEFRLPAALAQIGEYAFSYCEGPAELVIPEGLCDIRELKDLYAVERIRIAGEHSMFTSRDGVLFSRDGSELIWYPAAKPEMHYTVPDGVTKIADSAFEIHKRLKEAGNLHSVSMSEDVVSVGEKAFANCAHLEKVELSKRIRYIGMSAFFNCARLEEISLPEGIEELSYGLFYMCRSLRRIAIPNSVVRIADRAFYGCRSLEEIRWAAQGSDSCVGVRGDACAGERSDACAGVRSDACAGVRSDECVGVRSDVCADARGDACVSVRSDVCADVLGDAAEGDAYWLDGFKKGRLREIGDFCFHDCQFLRHLTIPDGVTMIGRELCSQCKNLEAVRLPQGLQRIGRRAFWGCRMLKTLEVPAGITCYNEWTDPGCVLKLYGIPLRDVQGNEYKKMAAIGYMQIRLAGVSILPGYEKGYEDYIRSHCRDFFDMALHDSSILHFLTEYRAIPDEALDELSLMANREGNTTAAAALLEYQHRKHVGQADERDADAAWDDILKDTGWF